MLSITLLSTPAWADSLRGHELAARHARERAGRAQPGVRPCAPRALRADRHRRMTVVMVHGNPETAAVWGPLLAELGRDDVVTLSPPGFGAPIPDGFGCTVGEYRDWLADELERMDGPVDLVGHDWGGGHVVNVAMSPAGPPAQLDDGRHRRVRPRVRVARPRPGLAGAGRGRAGCRGVHRAGRCRSARTGLSRAGSPTPRSPRRSRPRSGRRWAARSSRCTVRRRSR